MSEAAGPSVAVCLVFRAERVHSSQLPLRILSYVTLPFWKLRGLRWIAFNWTIEDILDPLLDEYEDAKLDEDTFPDMRELHFFFTSPATVRSLGSYLNRITHLNLLFIRDLENLDDLLRNLPYVESLTLQTLRENQEGQLLAAFEHGPFNFPRLTQLKICGEENEDPLLLAGVTALADVARGIPSLQCFDCSFCVESADLEVLSPAILSLKHLTVLGLHVGHLTAEKDTVRNVLRQMPAQLDALALTVSGGQLNEYELAELVRRIVCIIRSSLTPPAVDEVPASEVPLPMCVERSRRDRARPRTRGEGAGAGRAEERVPRCGAHGRRGEAL